MQALLLLAILCTLIFSSTLPITNEPVLNLSSNSSKSVFAQLPLKLKADTASMCNKQTSDCVCTQLSISMRQIVGRLNFSFNKTPTLPNAGTLGP